MKTKMMKTCADLLLFILSFLAVFIPMALMLRQIP